MRCEGYRRYGGAFTMGMPEWEQCREEAAFIMKCVQGKETSTFPSCFTCWEEAEKTGIKIINVKTIPNIGDSFFMSGGLNVVLKMRTASSYFGLRNPGFRFSVRTVEGGCRVWRIQVELPPMEPPTTSPA